MEALAGLVEVGLPLFHRLPREDWGERREGDLPRRGGGLEKPKVGRRKKAS